MLEFIASIAPFTLICQQPAVCNSPNGSAEIIIRRPDLRCDGSVQKAAAVISKAVQQSCPFSNLWSKLG